MGKSLVSCFLTHSVEIIIYLAQTVQVSINNTILMTEVLLAVYDLVISGFHFFNFLVSVVFQCFLTITFVLLYFNYWRISKYNNLFTTTVVTLT